MATKLSKRERTLLHALGDFTEAGSKVPFDILESIAGKLGWTVTSETGELKARLATEDAAASSSKKRRVESEAVRDPTRAPVEDNSASESSDDDDAEEDADLWAGGRRLIPEELLHDDGTTYLRQFKVLKLKDKRSCDAVQSLDQVIAAGDGAGLFQWLVSPCPADNFFSTLFEKRPLLVQRTQVNSTYYSGLFGLADVELLLKDGKLRYGFNIDVTHYTPKKLRQNFDSNGHTPADVQAGEEADLEVADPDVVWKRYSEGCSLRVLHPQRYCDTVWRLLAVLEHLFQCPVGCNAYLTPAGSQGFAPHFDDVDVFVLQLEGRKRWQVYKPLMDSILPRFSSKDFTPKQIGSPILEVELGPGDMLYLPRGTIHQAQSLPDHHSLHLTVSANQCKTWIDFMTPLIQAGLNELEQTSLASRLSTPVDYFNYMGLMYQDYPVRSNKPGPYWATGANDASDCDRKRFKATVKELAGQALGDLSVYMDSVADELCVKLLRQRLPPVGLPPAPRPPVDTLPPGLSVLRCPVPNIARMVDEGDEDGLTVVHCMNNSRTAHASLDKESAQEEEENDDDEEDSVLKLPYFLVPKELADVVEMCLRDGAGLTKSDIEVLKRQVPQDQDLVDEVILTMYNMGILTTKK